MYHQVTLAQFREDLKAKYDAAPFWTAFSELLAINDALRTWNMLTGTWRTRVTFETDTPNETPWYVLPGCMTYSTRVTWNGVPLSPTSIDSLDCGRAGWERENTSMGVDDPEIPDRPLVWAPAGVALIAIWPYDVAGCDMLVVDGVAKTPVLKLETDFVDIGQEDFNALLGYALHVLAFKEGGARFEVSKAYYKNFIKAAGERNSRFKASSLYRRIMGLDEGRYSKPSTALEARGA